MNIVGSATDVALTDIALAQGQTSGSGGAVRLSSGSLRLTHSSVSNSYSDGSYAYGSNAGQGGGIYGVPRYEYYNRRQRYYPQLCTGHLRRWNCNGCGDSVLTIEGSSLTENDGLIGGAISVDGTANISHTTIERNSAYLGGGGIWGGYVAIGQQYDRVQSCGWLGCN